MKCTDCEVLSVKCAMCSVEYGVLSECRVWNVVCDVWRVKCGVWSAK